jgi:nucleoside-diphosphate-sugar epimerase
MSTSMWRGQRVLVTGCTGFLGSAVTRELISRGVEVVGLVHTHRKAAIFAHECAEGRFHILNGRLEDPTRLCTAMAVHEVAAVFHMARLDREPRRADGLLLQATRRYLEDLPIVMARPSAELRLVPDGRGPGRLGIARFDELFGPGDDAERTIARLVDSVLGGHGCSTTHDSPRDHVFVQDAARACILLGENLATSGGGLDHTFRSGWEATEAVLAAMIADLAAGRRPAPLPIPSTANPLEWEPAATFTAALEETISAWRRAAQHSTPHHAQPDRLSRAA